MKGLLKLSFQSLYEFEEAISSNLKKFIKKLNWTWIWSLRFRTNNSWTFCQISPFSNLDQWMNERIGWVKGWMKGCLNESLNQWINESMNQWINESMNHWIIESMNHCIIKSINQLINLIVPVALYSADRKTCRASPHCVSTFY